MNLFLESVFQNLEQKDYNFIIKSNEKEVTKIKSKK